MRINNKVYHIHIVEEMPNQSRNLCKCKGNHYASSNSASSRDSVVEEIVFSEKNSDEGDGNGGEGPWQEEMQKGYNQDF